MKNRKLEKISITDFRNNLFSYLNDIFLEGKELIVEKGGLPMVMILPFYYGNKAKLERKRKLLGVLENTKGGWRNIPISQDEKERRKIELAASKRRKQEW